MVFPSSSSPRDPFVQAKLWPEDGLYLIQWSTSHLHRLILTVAHRDSVGVEPGWRLERCTFHRRALSPARSLLTSPSHSPRLPTAAPKVCASESSPSPSNLEPLC